MWIESSGEREFISFYEMRLNNLIKLEITKWPHEKDWKVHIHGFAESIKTSASTPEEAKNKLEEKYKKLIKQEYEKYDLQKA